MNDQIRYLLRYVCEGDIKRSQAQARIILNGLESKRDEQFKGNMLRTLDAKQSKFIELPMDLRGMLIAEDLSDFPMGRFVLRNDENVVVNKILQARLAADKLAEKGISYVPAAILHGESGGGKTMLARYIAHKAGLPFVYVRFSSIVSSYLGSTQSNIAKIFDYARSAPCVFCLDEVDAIGMARGQKNDVGEMNRIVISLMQEMDMLPNGVVVVATTNRFDRLDPALIRRFPIRHKVQELEQADIKELARKFFQYAEVDTEGWLDEWTARIFSAREPASAVVEKCTEKLVEHILRDTEGGDTSA